MEKENKIFMFKLFSGSYPAKYGTGWEKYNLEEQDGKYYGTIISRGHPYNISLENIDKSADKYTPNIDGILLIYIEVINGSTCIKAIAENTTIFRKIQPKTTQYEDYHTITEAQYMHKLDHPIPINIPKKCKYFFRAQRAYIKRDDRYAGLIKQILDKVFDYLDESKSNLTNEQEEDLTYDEVANSKASDNVNSNINNPPNPSDSNGKYVEKNPGITKRALEDANYMCEFDNNHKTFFTNKGYQYMEGHHLIRCTIEISQKIWEKYKKNIDTEANIVSLCPNCHRQIHFGNKNEKLKILTMLYKSRYMELEKYGISMSLNELKNIYDI